MEIYDNQENGYIAVWLTKEEKSRYDRDKLTGLLLSKTVTVKAKCKKTQKKPELKETKKSL